MPDLGPQIVNRNTVSLHPQIKPLLRYSEPPQRVAHFAHCRCLVARLRFL